MSNRFLFPSFFVLLFCLVSLLIGTVDISASENSNVHGILFYKPECSECRKIINTNFAEQLKKYGNQLEVLAIDNSSPKGGELFLASIIDLQVPIHRMTVPSVIIGNEFLAGSKEIAEKLPGLIAQAISNHSVGFPLITGMDEFVVNAHKAVKSQTNTYLWLTPETIQQNFSLQRLILNRIKRDLSGNSVAIFVFVMMVMILITTLFRLARIAQNHGGSDSPSFWIPLVTLIGLVAAGYLTYTEFMHGEPACGPIGNCKTVQASPYSHLFGTIPVAFLGALAYLFVLASWISQHFLSADKKYLLAFLLWLTTLVGTLFSAYLTFLEPFVIGATCIWCITNAIAITILLWISTPLAAHFLRKKN